MKLKMTFIAVSGLFALAACNTKSDQPTDPDAFRFIGRLYGCDSVQTTFTVGDSVGLYASSPLSVANRRGEYTSSAYVVMNPSIYPVEGASGSADIVAYKPYMRDCPGSEFLFSAKTDQSTGSAFVESCLYRAVTSVDPGDNGTASHLDFYPMTSLISLYFSNLTGKKISKVTVGGVRGTSSVNLFSGEIKASGTTGEYSGFAVPDSSDVYRFSLAPQTCLPSATVTFEDGDVRHFTLTDSITLAAGKSVSNEKYPIKIENIQPVDPEDFDKCVTPGVYSVVQDSIASLLLYKAGSDQYAVSTTSDSRQYRLQNLRGKWMFKLTTSTATLTVGADVGVKVETAGLDNVIPGEYGCYVLKVENSKAWLTCASEQVGYIINIENLFLK